MILFLRSILPSCAAGGTTEWFMITNSHRQVSRHVDLMFKPGKFVPVVPFTPATNPFCLKYPYCKKKLSKHKKVKRKALTLCANDSLRTFPSMFLCILLSTWFLNCVGYGHAVPYERAECLLSRMNRSQWREQRRVLFQASTITVETS